MCGDSKSEASNSTTNNTYNTNQQATAAEGGIALAAGASMTDPGILAAMNSAFTHTMDANTQSLKIAEEIFGSASQLMAQSMKANEGATSQLFESQKSETAQLAPDFMKYAILGIVAVAAVVVLPKLFK